MSGHKESECEFCQLDKIRKEALASDDIKVVKKAVIKFSNLWLCADHDLSHDEAILDGSWPDAEEILTRSLEKARKHNENLQLGPTGEYPKGKVNEDDEGELKIAIGIDKKRKAVMIDLGTKVAWMGLEAEEARSFANGILDNVNKLEKNVK